MTTLKKEADVLRDTKRHLSIDTRIAWWGRFNSGKGMMHGRWFVSCELFAGTKLKKKYGDDKGRIVCVDIKGAFIDGRELAIECKREGWKKPASELELRQEKALKLVSSIGGVAGFVTSMDDLITLLNKK